MVKTFFLFFIIVISCYGKSNNEKFIIDVTSCSNLIQKDYSKEQRVPIKLVVSQAIIESNWGRSRFAKEGNNFFGMRTWDLTRDHMKPQLNANSKFGLVIYPDLCSSVKDYIENINTSQKYYELRRVRAIELKLWDNVSAKILAKFLTSYSEEGEEYVEKVIRQIGFLNID